MKNNNTKVGSVIIIAANVLIDETAIVLSCYCEAIRKWNFELLNPIVSITNQSWFKKKSERDDRCHDRLYIRCAYWLVYLHWILAMAKLCLTLINTLHTILAMAKRYPFMTDLYFIYYSAYYDITLSIVLSTIIWQRNLLVYIHRFWLEQD